MRIITGTARGRRLVTLKGEETRPTTEKVKEAVFSAIQFDLQGKRVLDLFAGSGQIGLEALSRGASYAVFVDNSKEAVKIIEKNIEATGFGGSSLVRCSDYFSFVSRATDKFDVIFLDPPYNKGIFEKIVPVIDKITSEYATVIYECSGSEKPPEAFGSFSLYRSYSYGKTTAVSIYKNK